MTFEDVKRIRQNPTAEDVDNQELHKMIDLAIEKQIPKKINEHNRCPCCDTYNETIEKRRNTVKNDICYCWHCGQALDWGDCE